MMGTDACILEANVASCTKKLHRSLVESAFSILMFNLFPERQKNT